MAPIPVALCGKRNSHIESLMKSMRPEYEIIHVCQSKEAAIDELPRLLEGESVKPSSGYPSSEATESKDIKAVIIGGGFPPPDFESIKQACDSVRPLPYFRADITRAPPGQVGPPDPATLKVRIVNSMQEAERGGQSGKWAPGVHLF